VGLGGKVGLLNGGVVCVNLSCIIWQGVQDLMDQIQEIGVSLPYYCIAIMKSTRYAVIITPT
jgi:hypothetical protein